jgi:hypothetical protein
MVDGVELLAVPGAISGDQRNYLKLKEYRKGKNNYFISKLLFCILGLGQMLS